MANLILLGSNPSETSPDASPFHASTRSRVILDAWIDRLNTLGWPLEITFLNVSNDKKSGNKPLTPAEIKAAVPALLERIKQYPDHKVVALGKAASLACKLTGVEFYEMPHPSGLNRLLNDPTYVEEKLKGLACFISNNQAP